MIVLIVEEFKSPSIVERIFCNRTLNLRSIKAIGFDMDYTLLDREAGIHAYALKQFNELKMGKALKRLLIYLVFIVHVFIAGLPNTVKVGLKD